MKPVFQALADDAMLVSFGEAIDAATNAQVLRLAARLQASAPAWLVDVVPAYSSVAVFFDIAAFGTRDAHAVLTEYLRGRLTSQAEDSLAQEDPLPRDRIVEIPTCYEPELAPDLCAAAIELGMPVEELVARHCEPLYRVAMIGFAPGFPYLLGLPPALSLPRLATPRTCVAAGSVAIGGAQAGIYPRESPGGWRLLGRTPLDLFDPRKPEPSLLAPGDRVRFKRIDLDSFGQAGPHRVHSP